MILQSLSLFNFKNYPKIKVEFCDHINCIVGLNGSGKTNILDAIHYLSLTKSAFNTQDAQHIRRLADDALFVIEGTLEVDNKKYKVHCSLKKGGKKSFKVDELEYERLSEHVGRFPVVLIAPNDDELIRESNETRRKFFDSIISQTNKEYLHNLIQYAQALKQRNATLKQFAESGKIDRVLIDSYDKVLIAGSQFIAESRRAFITRFEPYFEANYAHIADQREDVGIDYQSLALESDFHKKFKNSFDKDLITQRTNMGIHRDEISLTINQWPLKKMGSQGQQKSVLISLKLAQFEIITQLLSKKPILLLDDIFDKLDDLRIQKLLDMIASDRFGQIFITDAREDRTKHLLGKGFEPIKIFIVENQLITTSNH